jgi:hypothetical protein
VGDRTAADAAMALDEGLSPWLGFPAALSLRCEYATEPGLLMGTGKARAWVREVGPGRW